MWVNKITKQYKKQNITRYSICFHLHTIKISACEHVKHKWISLDLTCQNRPTESSYVWYYLDMIKPQILYYIGITKYSQQANYTSDLWRISSFHRHWNIITEVVQKKVGYFCGLLLQLSTNLLPRGN